MSATTGSKPENPDNGNVSNNATASELAAQQGHGSTPSDFLSAVLGRPVVVKLNNGAEYHGILVCLDGYMNIVLEQTEQFDNGQLKYSFGDAFIRGNNVFYIATSMTKTAVHQSPST